MKKFLKTSFLVLVAAMLFAACKQPDEGPASNIEVSEEEFNTGNWLTDGVWHMDETTTQKFTGMGPEQESTSSTHVEMEINGDEITITNATITIQGQKQDITTYMQSEISSKQEALSSSQEVDLDDSMTMGYNFSSVEPEVHFYKSEDGTEYRVTVKMHLNFAEFMREFMGDTFTEADLAPYKNMNIDSNSEAIYKKQ